MKLTPATGALLSPTQQRKISRTGAAFIETTKAAGLKLWEAEITLAVLSDAQGVEVTGAELKKWLLDELNDVVDRSTIKTFFGDQFYYLPVQAELDEIWQGCRMNELVYTPERFDCDDYAFVLKGQASRYAYYSENWGYHGVCLGFVAGSLLNTGPGHAANIAVRYENGAAEVVIIEPANGQGPSLKLANGQVNRQVAASIETLII